MSIYIILSTFRDKSKFHRKETKMMFCLNHSTADKIEFKKPMLKQDIV